MKLKIKFCKKYKNPQESASAIIRKDSKNTACSTTPINCVDWGNNEEVYFVSDGFLICKWNTLTSECTVVANLPENFVTTDLHWLLLSERNSASGKGGESLLVCSNDGKFLLLNSNGRMERNISAHTGPINVGRWSPDGAGLLTAGEDGILKIWSRSGMLRSTVVQSDKAIRCARWSPSSTSIVFSQDEHISIKPLAANSKVIKWRAHNGLVISLCWSAQSNIIVSGGEDFRFKIWDTQGANLFTSAREEYAITSVEFSPEKDFLLIGSFNLLKVCSSNGWCYSSTYLSQPPVGSFNILSWSPNGTQVACGSSTGNLIIGYVIDQQIISRTLKATITGKKTIHLQDTKNASTELLDFPQPIINACLGYGHLIVATFNQLHIFSENYLNTPIIIEGRSDVRILQVGKKFFLALDATSIWIYTYNGRLHLNPRYPGSQAQIPQCNYRNVSLGLDIFAIRDNTDNTILHIFDLVPGASRNYEPQTLRSKSHIYEVAACRAGTVDDQFIVYIDTNRELFISESRNLNKENQNNTKGIFKIGSQVIEVKWASETNILVGLHDACYSIWYCPGAGAGDPTIIALTTVTLDTTDFGRNIMIESFEDAIVSFRCSGALICVNINIYCDILHRVLYENQWQQALKICRLANNVQLWATLAAFATRKNQLEISEEAYAAALQVDKVSYLLHIKELPMGSPEQMAESSLLQGHLLEAETILLHNRKYNEAVHVCLRMHNWPRALEIAQKHQPDLLETIFTERRKYLKALGLDKYDDDLILRHAPPIDD